LEAWEQVYFDNEDFFDDIHATIGCITCHGGTGGTDDMEAAHQGVVKDPDQEEACGTCHAQTVQSFTENGLHWDLQGYMTVLQERSDEEHMPQVMEAYDNHCATCHASCGQCHVSRPTSNGGGLLDGHVFKGTPPPYTTCTGCHGSRIENEFKGKNTDEEGNRYPADVHYNPGGMNCNDCHSGEEMHGEMGSFDHRYDGPETPSCADAGCHEDVGPGGEIAQHSAGHLAQLSCQACHAVTYKNCYNCHVQQSEEGVPYFKTDESQMDFRIGLNPIQSAERPWKYVPLRHVPVARDSFAYYGEDLLPNFDSRPTWTYATPHAIQRVTPQNQSCDCHNNLDLFLTADDVDPDELTANQAVIVAQAPAMALSAPLEEPTEEPATEPIEEPTEEPVAEPTAEPAVEPTVAPTKEPVEPPPTEAVLPPEAYSGPQTCGTCHPDRYEMWLTGPHAKALEDHLFQETWAEVDNARYCLACHTTGYNPNSGEYAMGGVTCEACHGPYSEGHPPDVVAVDRNGEVCQTCHPKAYDEWRASQHGQVGTRCVACHQICTLKTMRADDSHAVCENCHSEDADHFHQGTHNSEGLDCTDCHLHTGPGEAEHEGRPHISHLFVGNPESCIDCHGETIHMDNKIVSVEAQMATIEETGVPDMQQEIVTLEEERDTLAANVANRLYAGLVAGVIVGVAVGFGTGLFWKRWQHGRPI
jgi:thiosulfate/3-mercaptopyruvate sulfurtransferase